ncbi:M42 family peptidase [Brevibacillus fluminis]|uniref:M42 family peptidase n=1 Tax=Brevibacillus fluminis TaxID=511487 RepID=A0A3M8D103_9BACL|nr:M20/M25/M40 family metallo-hydrolase [Brevibacillus fluminis]RNB81241.1 M42 family peptidase [Brevibacillus fluminis]
MSNLEQMLVELDAIHGVSGDEERVAAYLKEQLTAHVDETYADSLGNHFFVKKGSDPELKLMLCAHMDEIGFIVNYIDERGFVSFLPVGDHDSRMVINQVLSIQTEQGVVHGITGGKPAHIVTEAEARQSIPLEDLFLDVGSRSREETLALGVRAGDYITFSRTGQFLNGSKVYSGKSVDNRSGCAVLAEVMKRLADREIVPTVYAVAAVQEEVGLRGAGVAAFSIQPDVALAIDVGLAGGTPHIEEKTLPMVFGGGPGILLFDWVPGTSAGNNVPKRLTRRLAQVAENSGIPYQQGAILNGVTDAYSISIAGKGTLTGCVCIPSRYIHSATGYVHLDDMEYTVQLIIAFIEAFQEKL